MNVLEQIKAVNTQASMADKITSNTEIKSFRENRQKKTDLDKEIDDKIDRLKKALADYVKSTQRDLEIQVHKATGKIIVRIKSKEDGKIIREIPAEYILNFASKFHEITESFFDERT